MNATEKKIEIYGPVFGTFGFRIISEGSPEYRERGFSTPEQARKAALVTIAESVHVPS